ncbi:hypothetical protein PSHT_02114 [Puccinia striiformis]|uniref:BZIP domain-containing protein n=1 Tax=Puccinia striiformis TaxID=27350 RepID=A0A2S4WIT7_9BASI|nr:hypothetical protein PSHT_02114 [Puccinia striiformis]
MASQSLFVTKNSSRHSLRSLAPLLNDLPSPSFSPQPSSGGLARPEAPSFQTKNSSNMPLHLNLAYVQPSASARTLESTHQPGHSHKQRAMNKSSSHDSSSGQSESPPTPSHHLYSMSPSSYQTYRPEWTSVSSPTLASSFDHPDYMAARPPKRHRQLLNPELRSPFCMDPPDRADTNMRSASPPPDIARNCVKNRLSTANPAPDPHTRHPLNPPSVSCSASSREADESSTYCIPTSTRSHLTPIPTSSHFPIRFSWRRIVALHLYELLVHLVVMKPIERAAQNRAAQRAFRERKDRYVRELEARSVQLEEYIVRYGLLEERERQVAAREAELIDPRPQSGLVDDGGSVNQEPTTSDKEKLNHINRLEHQLEASRDEVSRLRVELSKTNHEEEMNQNRRRVMDWERGTEEVSQPQTRSTSDIDTDAQTPYSSGSPCAPSSSQKSKPIDHHRPQNLTSQWPSGSYNEGNSMNRHAIPLRRANTLDGQDQLVKLPAIQSHRRRPWEDEKRVQ